MAQADAGIIVKALCIGTAMSHGLGHFPYFAVCISKLLKMQYAGYAAHAFNADPSGSGQLFLNFFND
jgi:hypothetical protein